ncbi:hypothetical protein DOY81_008919 [Sarcophaga bullata]|nr:hypothetical protein DOY81_008919 [Sarcophaga bullata]
MEVKLIEAVKNQEILYNKRSLLYRNKNKRASAWNAISMELNLPEDVCKTRWRYLRDKYVKKISQSHHASGNGAEIMESQWQYQSQMKFLREHIRSRKMVTSLSEEGSPTEILEKNRSESIESMPETLFSDVEFLGDPPSSNISTLNSESTSSPFEALSPSQKRSRRESSSEAFNKFLSKLTSIAEARFSRTESGPHDGFFGMVREMFDKMEPEAVENAKFYILNYLHGQRAKK